jgi:hypothetical protein
MRLLTFLLLALLIAGLASFSPSYSQDRQGVYVDDKGVLRWKETDDEVSLFGVNYTTPFAYSYRAHKRLGISLKRAVDLDVAQMVRLDLDAFRVHVWDREISDVKGNLLPNEHLDLFDYLLARLAEKGIKSILTPIAWWGIGWPEPDEPTRGFSQSYTKAELITNPVAREAERNYLRQFIEHRNPYRNLAYKDDLSIIAVEIINEPRHPETEQATTEYINEMIGVLRSAGYAKPIFYNISENWSDTQANAVSRSLADGISFQWYPTDLVHGRMLKGNYLMNVDAYPIPADNVEGFGRKARMVYEFDAADVGGSHMYPAMVRSFREAGMQFATMFSYDPVQIAWSNTEYPTHFVNLLYTPSKAISLMIAANAFRQLPRMKSYGAYPDNNRFQDFHVSYEEDLSEMNSEVAFLYSHSTQTVPKNARSLKRLAGVGESHVVRYDGTGAYFLDRLEAGIWRLEVYPDVLWLRDPFEATSMSGQVARLFWRERRIRIALPDLGEEYALHPLSSPGGTLPGRYQSEQLVRPGVYLVAGMAVDGSTLKKYLSKRVRFLENLYTPPTVSSGTYVVDSSNPYTLDSHAPEFRFQIASDRKISGAKLFVRRLGWRGWSGLPLKNVGGFDYVPVDTPKAMHSGMVEYCVAVLAGDTTYTFPEGTAGTPGTWDFAAGSLWHMKVLSSAEPLVLFDARRDRRDLIFPQYTKTMRYSADYSCGSNSEEVSLALALTFTDGNRTPFGIQLNAAGWSKIFEDQIGRYCCLRIKARSRQDSVSHLGINLVLADGKSYGAKVEINNSWQEHQLQLSSFLLNDALLLPNSYPRFLPKVWKKGQTSSSRQPDLRLLQSIQIVIDPEDARKNGNAAVFNCEIVSLELTGKTGI